jgi:hypothetical protein
MNYFQRITKGYGGFFTGLMLSGIALIGFGTTFIPDIYTSLIIVIGGTIFGTSFSHVISNLRGQDLLSEVKDILEYSLDADFTSDEGKLESYRKIFYHYHVTEIRGKYVWRLARIDFTSFAGIGSLGTVIDVKDMKGKDHKYTIVGGIRDDKFIMFEKASVGNEPCLVELFPFMATAFYDYHCGILILQSWDATHLISPCIMSLDPIQDCDKEGMVDDKVGKKLDEIWSERFLEDNKIVPLLKK